MATIHFIQQGKGGVGKSWISAVLYQFLLSCGVTVHAYDTDPVNATLAGYKEFAVTRLDIMKGDNIDARAFDALIEELVPLPDHAHAIIDNGASSFVALGSYLNENDVCELLQEHGHSVYMHSIIAGGANVKDTTKGLRVLAEGFPTVPIIVWLNRYHGDIELDGRPFEEFTVYKDCFRQFHAIIDIPIGNPATIGKDLADLAAKGHSFAAGINSSNHIAVRSRLKRYWNELVSILHQAHLIDVMMPSTPAPADGDAA